MGQPSSAEIPYYLPPSIFEIDFELMNDKKSKSYFNQLSSGEQQLIHTFQSVFYHLNNLQSAHLSATKRIKYEAINIIYDEIELYFHPEYQRKFVSELIKSFSRYRIGEGNRIKTINILLLTHSPFILSDIPAEHIMLLQPNSKGTAISSCPAGQTFAANINDLMADGFFLKKALMGHFAEKKIYSVIRSIKAGNKPTAEDTQILNLIGDTFLKSSLIEFKEGHYDKN